MSNIYRFNLSDNITELLTHFAKLHANDDRKTYKKNWEKWCEANQANLDIETRRLESLGYNGNVLDKIYKAGRYYFRVKVQERNKVQERRPYVTMLPELIEAMDEHINSIMKNADFTPAKGYNIFCATYLDLIRNEITRLRDTFNLSSDDIVVEYATTSPSTCRVPVSCSLISSLPSIKKFI